MIPDHIFEQYVIRHYAEYCKKNCYNSIDGKCVSCGCHAKAKAWSPLEECSLEHWAPIIWNKKEYEELRKEVPLEIKLEFNV